MSMESVRFDARAWLAPRLAVLLLVPLLLGVLMLAPTAAEALVTQSFFLRDQGGHPWSLTLMEQGDPAYSAGLRLRLTDRSGSQQLDHSRPLALRDGVGGEWELANRSAELVPAGDNHLPAGSAQFDLDGLQPRPRAELPLALEVPLVSGASAQLVAGAPAVAALHRAAEP